MKEKIGELRKTVLNQNFYTKYIVCDFSKLTTMKHYTDLFQEELKSMDVGMVVLNAGVATLMPFKDLKDDELEAMVNVNALQIPYFIKMILP